MKFFYKILSQLGVYFIIFTSEALANGDDAHAPGEMHNDAVAIDPLIIIIVPIVLIVGGLILWKFVLNNHKSSSPTASVPEKTPPAQEKTVSQNNQIDNSQKNG